MTFNALVIRKTDNAAPHAGIEQITVDELPAGDVVVAVEYSTLNYKDGLCLGNGGGMVRQYPHVAGIDFAGVVESSEHADFNKGDRVVLTGWRVGEIHWGGYAQKARVKGDWLVKLPKGISNHDAMAIGTAGLTAMLAIQALQNHSVTPQNTDKPVIVTGASGGVGSVAVHLLSKLGYGVAAVTGRPETSDYLHNLGATEIIPREEVAETIKHPLESERFSGGIDTVGGAMLARLLGQIAYGGSVAAVGLAGGMSLPATVIPFLLRGVNLLGIDSVMQPLLPRQAAWAELDRLIDRDILHGMVTPATLKDLPELGRTILAGQVRGRVVVDVNAN